MLGPDEGIEGVEADDNAWLLQRFKKVIQALARIDHPAVVRALDVGIATVLDPPSRSNMKSTMVAGTIGYMAPERLEGRPTAASDIYVLGLISCEMVTGRRPSR